MLFNYGILGSYLFAALLIILIGRLRTFRSSTSEAKDENRPAKAKDAWIWLRLLFLTLALVISSRMLFMFAFSDEIKIAGIELSLSFEFLVWLNFQAILAMIYTWYLVLFGLYFRLNPDVRTEYLRMKSKQLLRIILFDFLLLFTAYIWFNFEFTFPTLPSQVIGDSGVQLIFHDILWLVLIGLLIPFVIFYIQYRKNQKPLYLKIYGIIFIFILFVSVYTSLYHLDKFFQLSENITDRILLFGLQKGFYGWFWIIFIMLTFLSYIMVFQIRKLKTHFINIQFFMNMMSHSLRFNFNCTIGLVFLSIVPLFIRWFYS